jgi:hypothetical protein
MLLKGHDWKHSARCRGALSFWSHLAAIVRHQLRCITSHLQEEKRGVGSAHSSGFTIQASHSHLSLQQRAEMWRQKEAHVTIIER